MLMLVLIEQILYLELLQSDQDSGPLGFVQYKA